MVLQKALEGAGHEVITADDGLEAFEKYCVSRARVVVSDWEMPEMSGLELCQIIRERPSVEYTYFLSTLPKISRHFNHGKHGKHGKKSSTYQIQYLRKLMTRYLGDRQKTPEFIPGMNAVRLNRDWS
ncbi:MAG: response regulator [Acidobacteria bacterium]|nr:response regulator [Acidobacteriota bacterium]